MADIGVKMGVTGLSTFKSSMNQAQQSVKTLDAELKLNAEQYKASGDAETYMANKSKILQKQIAEQQKVVKAASDALEKMAKDGVDPASTAYQKMQQQLYNAQAALAGMQNNLNGVGTAAKNSADQATELNTNLKNIGKQVSFQSVITGIGKITDGMEKAATNVAKFASNLWDTMRDAATWADDKMTLATMYGIDVEQLQKMEAVAESTIDTPVEAIIKGQQKLKNNLVYGNAEFDEALKKLRVGIKEGGNYWQNNYTSLKMRDADDIFWDMGEALMNYGDEIERDAMAQKVFGRSWMELRPLFEAGRNAYEEALESHSVVSEENMKSMADLSDNLATLENEFNTLKLTVLSSLAPALNEVSTALTGVLKQVNEYLKSDEGQEKLQALGDAVARLFDGLTNIDTEQVIEKVGNALDAVVEALGWINDNKEGIVNAIKAIGAAFIGLKVAEVAGSLAQGALALKNLFGGGSTPTTSVPSNMGTAINTATAVTQGAAITSQLAAAFPGAAAVVNALMSPIGLAALGVMAGIPVYENIKNGKIQKSLTWTPGTMANVPHVNPLSDKVPTSQQYRDTTAMLQALANGEAPAVSQSADKSADQLINAILSGEAQGSSASHSGTGGTYTNWVDDLVESVVGEVDNKTRYPIDPETKLTILPGSSEPNPEMQAAGEDLFAALRDAGDAAEDFAERVNSIRITGPQIAGIVAGALGGSGAIVTPWAGADGFHANGLPWVPYDGYIAALHKGERVVPANRNMNVYNNTYFDRTTVSGGVDADGLAARIATAQQRALAAVGS